MKCSVFIATSADGYIATREGGVDWLHTASDLQADMGSNPDMGFEAFIDSVDCMIMGRKCMETIASMDLSPEQWPYRDLPIIVLSRSLSEPPENLQGKVELHSGDIKDLLSRLKSSGYKHAYVDGGATISSFLNLKLINQLTITQAPVILGDGIPLFSAVDGPIKLEQLAAKAFPNNFVQIKYQVNYC